MNLRVPRQSKTLKLILVLFLIFNFSSAGANEADNQPNPVFLSDLREGDLHFVAINNLVQNNIIHGYEDGTFRSKNQINRAEALKIILLANGLYSQSEIDTEFLKISQPPFADTPLTEWYTKYVYFAQKNSLIEGYPDGTFRPNEAISLAEALKIYLESMPGRIYPEITGNTYADIDNYSWYSKYFAFAKIRTALDIQLNNYAYPDQKLNRGYLAEIIYRLRRYSDGYYFGKATFYDGVYYKATALTTAHRTLPYGTKLIVTNLANNKSVEVIVSDRGPYGAGRELDLAKPAFAELAPLSSGVINIEYKIIE